MAQQHPSVRARHSSTSLWQNCTAWYKSTLKWQHGTATLLCDSMAQHLPSVSARLDSFLCDSVAWQHHNVSVRHFSTPLWKHGTAAPQCVRTAQPISKEAWKYVSMVACQHGSRSAWKHGSMETWQHGSMAASLGMAWLGQAFMAAWHNMAWHGSMEAWQHGLAGHGRVANHWRIQPYYYKGISLVLAPNVMSTG